VSGPRSRNPYINRSVETLRPRGWVHPYLKALRHLEATLAAEPEATRGPKREWILAGIEREHGYKFRKMIEFALCERAQQNLETKGRPTVDKRLR